MQSPSSLLMMENIQVRRCLNSEACSQIEKVLDRVSFQVEASSAQNRRVSFLTRRQ
jgi:hypothetical protein